MGLIPSPSPPTLFWSGNFCDIFHLLTCNPIRQRWCKPWLWVILLNQTSVDPKKENRFVWWMVVCGKNWHNCAPECFWTINHVDRDVCSFYGLPHYDLWGIAKPQYPCRETTIGEFSDCSFMQAASRSQMVLLICSHNPHRKLQCIIRCCKTLSVPPAFEFASGLQRRAGDGL